MQDTDPNSNWGRSHMGPGMRLRLRGLQCGVGVYRHLYTLAYP